MCPRFHGWMEKLWSIIYDGMMWHMFFNLQAKVSKISQFHGTFCKSCQDFMAKFKSFEVWFSYNNHKFWRFHGWMEWFDLWFSFYKHIFSRFCQRLTYASLRIGTVLVLVDTWCILSFYKKKFYHCHGCIDSSARKDSNTIALQCAWLSIIVISWILQFCNIVKT